MRLYKYNFIVPENCQPNIVLQINFFQAFSKHKTSTYINSMIIIRLVMIYCQFCFISLFSTSYGKRLSLLSGINMINLLIFYLRLQNKNNFTFFCLALDRLLFQTANITTFQDKQVNRHVSTCLLLHNISMNLPFV